MLRSPAVFPVGVSSGMSSPPRAGPCTVAFIGAGFMTSEHIKAFHDVPGVTLGGIHSRTAARAAQLAQQSGMTVIAASIAELYERTKADLVVISVPELAVREVCAEAFRYPWACLIEKPAGYDVNDARQIARDADQANRKAFVALNRRHYASTRQVLRDLAGTDSPRLIHVFDQQDQIAARAAGQPELVVRNWMYANSIHLVDYLTILGRGRITTVDPVVAWDAENPSFVVAKITYNSGDVGLYSAVWNAPGPWAVTVTTHQRRWELRPLEQASFQNRDSRKLEQAPSHEWDTRFKAGLRAQAEEAVKAVTGRAHTLPTVGDAIRSMELVQAIYG